MSKIVGWGSSQKHVNCFDQGFKCFCKSFFHETKMICPNHTFCCQQKIPNLLDHFICVCCICEQDIVNLVLGFHAWPTSQGLKYKILGHNTR